MKISQATCSYEILQLKSLLLNSPNQFNYFKRYLTWLGFELKIFFWKTKPLSCFNQLSYWFGQDWGQFFKALGMRKRDDRCVGDSLLSWPASLSSLGRHLFPLSTGISRLSLSSLGRHLSPLSTGVSCLSLSSLGRRLSPLFARATLLSDPPAPPCRFLLDRERIRECR